MWRLILVSCAFVALVHAKNLGQYDLVEDDWEPVSHKTTKLNQWHRPSCNCTVATLPKNFVPKPLTKEEMAILMTLPKKFDARDKWGKMCKSLNYINDQSQCGACWAFGSTEAMSDRLCIHSKGKVHVQLSAAHMTACDKTDSGCKGGNPPKAYSFYEENGIVSGTDYAQDDGCWPYPYKCAIYPQERGHYPDCTGSENYTTPICEKKCPNRKYNNTFEQDLHFGLKHKQLESVEKIMVDIYQNGPVTASFRIYDNFDELKFDFKNDIYSSEGATIKDEGHSIKIIGWGVENNIPYWLCVNSYGPYWGMNGLFKFRRGVNDCGIEEAVFSGLPDLNRKA